MKRVGFVGLEGEGAGEGLEPVLGMLVVVSELGLPFDETGGGDDRERTLKGGKFNTSFPPSEARSLGSSSWTLGSLIVMVGMLEAWRL